jgi:hypothetical protein
MRRLTIILTVVVIAASLGVGIYLVSVATSGSGIDKMDRVALSSADSATLYHLSLQPYGPTPGAGIGTVTAYSGTPFTLGGKPIVVYIGAEYCEYCAVTRWGLILALERFGNFTGLQYMTSSVPDLDLPTFTFVNSHYTSNYLVFQPYEDEDRAQASLSPPPSNYSTIWTAENHNSFPFIDFGNKYVAASSLIGNPQIIQNKNWTQVFADVSTGTTDGLLIKESANLITGVLCKLTGGSPGAVCGASPIGTITSSLASPLSASATFSSTASVSVSSRELQTRLPLPRVR